MATSAFARQISFRSWQDFFKTTQCVRIPRSRHCLLNDFNNSHKAPRCLTRSLTTSSDDRHIVRSPHKPVDIPDVTFTEFMLAQYKQFGDLTAVKDVPTGRSYTFKDLQDATTRVASALTRLGVRQGDRILLFSTNCPEYLIVFLACGAIGAVISTANPNYTTGEIGRQLEHSGSTYVITLPGLLPTVKEAISKSEKLPTRVKQIIVLGEGSGAVPFKTLLEDDGKAFPENVDVSPDDLFVLPYSSGTTGLPKGVMLSHRNIVANVLQTNKVMLMKPGEDSLLGVLPLFHIYGLVVSKFSAIAQGATFLTVPRFTPETFLNAIQDEKITYLHLVPPLLLFLAKDPQVGNYDVSSVHTIICGAAPLGEDLCQQLRQRVNANIRQAYGLTETSPIVCFDLPDMTLGTVGPLGPNTDGKVVDLSTGETLPPGETGEICFRGPQVMLGYLDNQQATNEMIKDGWLHSGDIGHFDKNGKLVVTDRLKELIKYKGFQVPPAELESVLLSHPGVQDAAVLGVPDQEAGEIPKAFVVPKPGHNLTPQDVVDFVKDKVASYKQLRGGVTFVDSIPKTPSGKILRRELKHL